MRCDQVELNLCGARSDARHNGALASAYLAQFNGQAVNAALLATARALAHSLADIGRAIDYAPDVEF